MGENEVVLGPVGKGRDNYDSSCQIETNLLLNKTKKESLRIIVICKLHFAFYKNQFLLKLKNRDVIKNLCKINAGQSSL